MATPTRPWFPGASYHITSRGNHKETIFLDKEDYHIYISLIENTLTFYKDYNYKLLSYCLMSNHVHLLIKTDQYPPKFFMQRLNSLYVKHFNNKYNYVGHLFQSRYFSNIITSEFELLEVSKYIHLNPVKANIVKKPQDYKWSSYIYITSNNLSSYNYPHLDFSYILDIVDIYLTIEENITKNINSTISNNISKVIDKKDKYMNFVNIPSTLDHIYKGNKLYFHDKVLLNNLKLNTTDSKIIKYIKENIEKVVNQSIQKTSSEIFVVPNSIVRLSKKLGYSSFSEMKLSLREELNSCIFYTNNDISS